MRFVVTAFLLSIFCAPIMGLAATHDFSFPKTELKNASKAIEAIRDDRPEKAITIASTLKNEPIKQLVEWAIYKSPGSPVSATAIWDFATKHPYFPEQEALKERAEEMLLARENLSPEEISSYFTTHSPASASAKWHLANSFFIQKTSEKEANILLKEAWHSAHLSEEEAQELYQRYKAKLSKEDITTRISHLLWANRISAAKRLLHLTSSANQRLFSARITLQTNGYGVDKAVANVPNSLKNDAGLVYDRTRWRERKGMESAAIELLTTIENTGASPHSTTWWKMRKRLIRDALKLKKYQSAYTLASTHKPQTRRIEHAESEWLAGWIAARFLHNPRQAYEHFYRMHQKVSYPISLARASYWAGHTATTNGNADIAKKWYQKAAEYPLTFYGQLAITQLGEAPTLTLPKTPETNRVDRKLYQRDPLIPAIHALIQMNELGLAKDFINHAIKQTDSPTLRVLISQIGDHYNQTHLSVYAARTAAQEGQPLIQAGYPVFPMNFKMHSQRELAHAITLQESRFDSRAGSHAGAQGLMQLMPATARRTARMLREHYRRSKLIYDPAFNVRLGSHYINHLRKKFDGQLVLAIAAYNAGPGNVRKWLKTYGDPRSFETTEQIIDWIEMIPFSETRNYVQRVLENMQVYRAISGEKEMQLKRDLVHIN